MLRREHPLDRDTWSRGFRDMAHLVAEDLADHADERASDGTWPLRGVLRRVTGEPVPDACLHLSRDVGTQNAHARSARVVQYGLDRALALLEMLPSIVQDLVAQSAVVTPGRVESLSGGAVVLAEWRVDELVRAATTAALPAGSGGDEMGGVWWPDVEPPAARSRDHDSEMGMDGESRGGGATPSS